eukprot:NODE_432_length_8732_cov_0.302907.p6 type:complete len:144 gc:universal NODE_432_length_8732_cov_0.302907:6242-6673(+)
MNTNSQIHEPLANQFYFQMCNTLSSSKVRAIGNSVGEQIVEIATFQTAPFHDPLACLKWIAKDFWNLVFKKNITHLKTDRKNTFILEDHEFKWIYSIQQDTLQYIEFASGLIQGAVTALSGPCSITVQVEHPKVIFFIKMGEE